MVGSNIKTNVEPPLIDTKVVIWHVYILLSILYGAGYISAIH